MQISSRLDASFFLLCGLENVSKVRTILAIGHCAIQQSYHPQEYTVLLLAQNRSLDFNLISEGKKEMCLV